MKTVLKGEFWYECYLSGRPYPRSELVRARWGPAKGHLVHRTLVDEKGRMEDGRTNITIDERRSKTEPG